MEKGAEERRALFIGPFENFGSIPHAARGFGDELAVVIGDPEPVGYLFPYPAAAAAELPPYHDKELFFFVCHISAIWKRETLNIFIE